MYEHKTIEMNRCSWDTISAHYQASTRISTDDVHYSTLAPGERELGLLGDGSAESLRSVTGKRVIEIGCCGGQNSIALSKWGATCVGIDPSPAQIAHARRLAVENGVEVQFVEGIAEDLSAFPDSSFDIALSSYAFDYVTNLRRAYDEAWRVLRSLDPTSGKPGGLFVFCLSHPWFQAVGWHLSGDPDAPEIGDYAAWPDVQEFDERQHLNAPSREGGDEKCLLPKAAQFVVKWRHGYKERESLCVRHEISSGVGTEVSEVDTTGRDQRSGERVV